VAAHHHLREEEGLTTETQRAQRRQKTEKKREKEEDKNGDNAMDEKDPLTHAVIGAAIEVHRVLGPGLLEAVYQRCLEHELHLRGIPFKRQERLPISYKGVLLDAELVMDLYFPGQLVVELKAVEKMLPVHDAQLLTYLRLSCTHVGLLINFNVMVLKDGIKRLVL
jgi:GxxExxY protein